FSFTALVVVGDGRGHVGVGLGKAREVPEAIRKSVEHAKKDLIFVPLKDTTIPCEMTGQFGAARGFMKPASRCGRCWRRRASRTCSPRRWAPTIRTTCSRRPSTRSGG